MPKGKELTEGIIRSPEIFSEDLISKISVHPDTDLLKIINKANSLYRTHANSKTRRPDFTNLIVQITECKESINRLLYLVRFFTKKDSGWEYNSANTYLLLGLIDGYGYKRKGQETDDALREKVFPVLLEAFKEKCEREYKGYDGGLKTCQQKSHELLAIKKESVVQSADSKLFSNLTDAAKYAVMNPQKMTFCLCNEATKPWQLFWINPFGKSAQLILTENLSRNLDRVKSGHPDLESGLYDDECKISLTNFINKTPVIINPVQLPEKLVSTYVLIHKPPQVELFWYDSLSTYSRKSVPLNEYPKFEAWLKEQTHLKADNILLKSHLMNINVINVVDRKKQQMVYKNLSAKKGVALIETDDITKIPLINLRAGMYILECRVLYQRVKKDGLLYNHKVDTRDWLNFRLALKDSKDTATLSLAIVKDLAEINLEVVFAENLDIAAVETDTYILTKEEGIFRLYQRQELSGETCNNLINTDEWKRFHTILIKTPDDMQKLARAIIQDKRDVANFEKHALKKFKPMNEFVNNNQEIPSNFDPGTYIITRTKDQWSLYHVNQKKLINPIELSFYPQISALMNSWLCQPEELGTQLLQLIRPLKALNIDKTTDKAVASSAVAALFNNNKPKKPVTEIKKTVTEPETLSLQNQM